MRTLILTVVLLSLIPFSLYASARPNSGGLAERVAELEAQVEEFSAILQFVYVETEEINGLAGPHWIIEGANVHVRSGSGLTSDDCSASAPNFPVCESLTGLGNLVVGYNGELPFRSHGDAIEIRTGSHNLILGDENSYSSYAGLVAGVANRVYSPYASVCGGTSNEASGLGSSVCGGQGNVASGRRSSVSGGAGNVASAHRSSVSGGQLNVASGESSSVSGGDGREAPDDFNWAAGNLLEPN